MLGQLDAAGGIRTAIAVDVSKDGMTTYPTPPSVEGNAHWFQLVYIHPDTD